MIKNERQHNIAKSQLKKFADAIEQFDQKIKSKKIHPLLIKAQKQSLQSQHSDIQEQINYYDNLRKSKTPILELSSFEEIPITLIKARIALGLSQKDLAERIGLKEQQIQRYEFTEYSTASIAKVKEIIKALDIEVKNSRSSDTIVVKDFFNQLKTIGIEKEFIVKRVLPSKLISYFENQKDTIPNYIGYKAASHVGRVFNLDTEKIFNNQSLQLDTSSIEYVQFKKPKNTSEPKLRAYTLYAHYLANLLLQATEHLPRKPLPTNPYDVHKAIISSYGSINLENIVRYVWDLGIPILTLEDPGSFHGVSFYINERNVIVLKQNTTSTSRWMFDLLHEFWHASNDPKIRPLHEMEKNRFKHEAKNSDEDIANKFAAAALLGRDPNELIDICVKKAKHHVPRLKATIHLVAKRENVSVSALANCVAFRYAKEGNHDLWGIAANLQDSEDNPRKIIRNVLFENINFSSLAEADLELLKQSITYEKELVNE